MKKIYVLLLILTGLGISCGPEPMTGDAAGQSIIKHQDDIPVPSNFIYDSDRSRIESFPSFRLCEMIYISGRDARHGVTALEEFYIDLMPNYGWKLLGKTKSKPGLVFKKDGKNDEYCRIEFFRNKTQSSIYILIGNEVLIKTRQ